MAQKSNLTRNASGLFLRNLGWKRTRSGYTQHKFYLGRDESIAMLASLRLEELWKQIETRWERETKSLQPTMNTLAGTSSLETTSSGHTVLMISGLPETEREDRPVWDATSLVIAEAVRSGKPVAHVELPSYLKAHLPESHFIGLWLSELQACFTGIKIELERPESHLVAQQSIAKEGRRLVDLGRKMLRPRGTEETLHEAFEAYRTWIAGRYQTLEQRMTQWGRGLVRQTNYIQRHVPDQPLAELDSHRIEEIIDLLRMRPKTARGQTASVGWSRNCIKRFHDFVRWLHRSPEFTWRRPADLEWKAVKIPVTTAEKSAFARTAQIATYSLEELKTLWLYATPMQRLLMLLALNCGFGRAEVASLESCDVYLRECHPHERDLGITTTASDSWIRRVRIKSTLYGEWKLWPETVAAIDWWRTHRLSRPNAGNLSTLLVTEKGERFDEVTAGNNPNFQIQSLWASLTTRIRKELPEFRKLSFNKLRKTAASLIRSKAGGEIASVFLCHGSPVGHDELVEVYTNRPYAKVFAAIDEMGEGLRPVFSQADLDCNGWPQTGRRKALEAIRRVRAVHLCGDQHLAVVVKHGITEPSDGPFAFTSPALVNTIYGRWWHPLDEKAGPNPVPNSPLPWTGKFKDGLGNMIRLLAYANPENINDEKKRADGYGIARFDKKQRTVTFECWPRFATADKSQFPGWPITVNWDDNDGRKPVAWLPMLEFERDIHPVLKVTDAKTGDVMFVVRVTGPKFQPPVFANGNYTITVGRDRPDGATFENITAGEKAAVGVRTVKL
ncbi:hypothetical protein BH11PLA2_BH11PLA2_46020 [soil metagenome]